MIHFENFTYQYPERENPSVRNIDLHISPGECVVITGPSGCGKTTLTRCINGLIPDNFGGTVQGDCSINGLKFGEHQCSEIGLHVGSVFQDPRSQFFTLHVDTEIAFTGENHNLPKDELQKNFSDVVSQFEIENLLDKKIFALSSGEKQEVALASVAVSKPKIYVLDEPSANLDTNSTNQLRSSLKRLKESGVTIVISEHKLYYLTGIADRYILMNDGEITEQLSAKEFLSYKSSEYTEKGLRNPFLCPHMSSPAPLRCAKDTFTFSAENLSFHYPHQKDIWKNVSMKFQSGEIVGIVGHNGAGKTTLLKSLCGLLSPKGEISINGVKQSRKKRIANSFYVMQDVDYQLFYGTVLDEMLSVKDDKNAAYSCLKSVDLQDFAEAHPTSLSGGQKQRLSIALALLNESSVLCLDEPTSGLDYRNMQLVKKALLKRAEDGTLIFIITHDYQFAAETFHALITINEKGEIHTISSSDYSLKSLSCMIPPVQE